MKRIKTRVLALLLSCCLVTIGTVGSYQTAQAAEIVAGGAIVGTLEEILLSFGIFLLPSSMTSQAQNSDWWYSEDGNAALKPYYDDLASEYEKERFKVINGGGGDSQPSPTPVPEQKPEIQPTPVPEVKPGEIPTFDELVAPALAGGAISWATGAWDTMAKAVGNLWDKIMGNSVPVYDMSDNPYTSKHALGRIRFNYEFSNYINAKDFYLYTDTSQNVVVNYLDNNFKFSVFTLDSDEKLNPTNYYYYVVTQDNGYLSSQFGAVTNPMYGNVSYLSGKMPWAGLKSTTFVNGLNCSLYVNGEINNSYLNDFVKENIWVHPDLQETYQNNGKLEYPQQAPQPLQYPSAENLADLAKKLNPEINPDYSPEIAPNYVQELIQKLQQNPSVNPDPNPNPNPDPGTNPQPTLKPNPTDTPGQPESPEDEVKPYTADLTKVFPFCIPFDLIHLFKVLDAEPEAPVFKIPIELKVDNPFNGKSIVDYEDTMVINLSDYEQPIKVIRIFEVIFFLIGLMLITRSHMIKG